MASSLKESFTRLVQLLDELRETNDAVGKAIDLTVDRGEKVGRQPIDYQRMTAWTDLARHQKPTIAAHIAMVNEVLDTYSSISSVARRAKFVDRGLKIASWITLGILAIVVTSYLIRPLKNLVPASTSLLVLSLAVSAIGFALLSVQINKLDQSAKVVTEKVAQLRALEHELEQFRHKMDALDKNDGAQV